MSGNKDTGNVKYVTSPTMKQAVNAISTAIGRFNRNFTIMVTQLSSPEFHAPDSHCQW